MKYTVTLKKNYEFKNLLQKGKWFSGKYVVLYILPQKDVEHNKIGFIVSRKSGNSVFRNRTRRILRQAYSDIEESIKKGHKILIMWKKKNTEKNLKSNDIYEDLSNILKESDMLI